MVWIVLRDNKILGVYNDMHLSAKRACERIQHYIEVGSDINFSDMSDFNQATNAKYINDAINNKDYFLALSSWSMNCTEKYRLLVKEVDISFGCADPVIFSDDFFQAFTICKFFSLQCKRSKRSRINFCCKPSRRNLSRKSF